MKGIFRKFLAVVISSFSLMGFSPMGFSQAPSEVRKGSEDGALSIQEEVVRQRKVQAYAKLMEGQRYLWQMGRSRFRSNAVALANQAKQAFLKAVELNPELAEGYTALAELALYEQPPNYDEAISYAQKAVKANPNNFGARRILAGVYSIRSGLNSNRYNQEFARRAKDEWLEVTRLDPRNAEAWAFLSAFYEKEGNQEKRIEALRQWLASVSPIEARFYRMVFGNLADLSPENASLKLADALIKTNRSGEAIEILTRLVADQPGNGEAVELLREVLGFADTKLVSEAISTLERTALSEPGNFLLVDVLVEAQIHAKKNEDAIKALQSIIKKLSDLEKDKTKLAAYYFKLGDVYFEANSFENSINSLEQILRVYGIGDKTVDSSEKVEVAERVFGRMIYFCKHFGRYTEASALIERARRVLGAGNLFPDKEMISLLAESGRRREALQYIYSVRKKNQLPDVYLQEEAEILASLGRVEEAISLIKGNQRNEITSSNSVRENEKRADINTLIRTCQIYLRSDRVQEAIREASRILELSQNDQQRMIAKILLSAAYYEAGDFVTSERILREMIQKSPNNPILLNNLGYFLAERNEKLEEALELVKKAVKIDPNNPSYLDSLGYVYFRLGNKEEAEKYFRRAVRQGTNSSEIYEHLGDVYQTFGKVESARMAWQRAFYLATNEKSTNRIREKLKKVSR